MAIYFGIRFTEKEQNRWRNFFSSSGNAICSILLKYQEIYVEMQTFTDENETLFKVALLNGTICN